MQTQLAELMKIGELSQESGISLKAIRYYEELGLIKADKRTEGGFHLFSKSILPRLKFIKQAQNLGFRLQEIGSFMDIHDRGETPCKEVTQNIQSKILEIEDKIQKLEELKAQLKVIVSDSSHTSLWQEEVICPIIQQDVGI